MKLGMLETFFYLMRYLALSKYSRAISIYPVLMNAFDKSIMHSKIFASSSFSNI